MSDEVPDSIAPIQAIADGIRRLVLAMAIRNNGAYLAQACSAAEILATLYAHSMRLGLSTGEPSPTEFKRVPRPGTDSPWGGCGAHIFVGGLATRSRLGLRLGSRSRCCSLFSTRAFAYCSTSST